MRLQELQVAFAEALREPLEKRQKEGLEVYHQQYWWRLLKTLQDNFPMVTRLFGYKSFNREIAEPYLMHHPPSHWALCQLGQTLPQWLQEHYQQSDRELVIQSAKLDAACGKTFWCAQKPTPIFTEEITQTKLWLQPHCKLFLHKIDLCLFREQLLKQEVDYYNRNPFPKIEPGPCYSLIFRNPKNAVVFERLSTAQYLLLSHFQKGDCIEEACAHLEQNYPEADVGLWFHKWTRLKLFCTH